MQEILDNAKRLAGAIGKSERYIQTHAELDEHLLTAALQGIQIFSAGATEPLPSAELREFMGETRVIDRIATSLDRRGIDSRIVEAAALGARLTAADLAADALDRAGIEARMTGYLENAHADVLPVEIEWTRDEEHSLWCPSVRGYQSGITHATSLDSAFLESADYERMLAFADRSAVAGPTPFRLVAGDRSEEIGTARQLLARVIELGTKGLQIQRYKGLGEMNPEQLWETTMDPEIRTFLQVRIEDRVEADSTFSVLMGDAVEPRKEFIERNALNVTNLDI